MNETNGRIMRGGPEGVRSWAPLTAGARWQADDAAGFGSERLQQPTATEKERIRWQGIRERMASRIGDALQIESAEVLAAVAAHREYWRPRETRVLLLAESHVMTTLQELSARVPLTRFGHPEAPSEFVRLVYCLGYGESAVTEGGEAKNIGTPQFWKIFAACAADLDGGSLLRRGEPDWLRRIARKIALLEKLQRRGVWLLDASPIALYWGSRKKPAAKVLRSALIAGWEEYSREVVSELSPRAVVFIGKTVFDVLGERVREVLPAASSVDWMYQPQAQLPTLDHQAGLAKLWRIVMREGLVES